MVSNSIGFSIDSNSVGVKSFAKTLQAMASMMEENDPGAKVELSAIQKGSVKFNVFIR